MPGAAPRLETERLILRQIREDDLEGHAEMLGDPEVVRFIGGSVHSREESWRKMLMAPGMWALLGFGFWAVERKEDGAFLGQAGFGDFQRDMQPRIEGIEMGWLFLKSAHGRGYASEAVAAALAWGEKALPGRRFEAVIDPRNAPSIRLAEKAGFSERLDALYKGERILLFRRPA